MGLFRKKDKNVNKDNVIESIDPKEMVSNDKNSEMEILEFSDNDIKKEIKKINSKENRLLFGIIILLIVFVFFLPTITSFVSSNSMFTYNRVVEDIVNTNTVDGMLEIGKDDGSITAKNIQFYNPSKKSNSEIQIVYLPDTTIKNLDGLNIYIELYNSNKSIIYRTPFIVSSLDRKVQGTYRLQVNSKIYTEASYAKITIIDEDEFIKSNNTLICTNNFEDGNYKVQEKVIYNFSDKGLVTYEVSKKAVYSSEDDDTNTTNDKYVKLYEKEANDLSKTNITDVDYDDNSLSYSVDLKKFVKGNSSYDVLYDLGSVMRQIKLGEESKNWSCK